MKYEMQWQKRSTRVFDKAQKKLVTVYEPRFTETDFDDLKTGAEAALGDKFVGFELRDEPTCQVTAIEYADQPTPEETAALNGQLDVVLDSFMQESEVTPWV